MTLGTPIEVTGTVARVRERAGLNFVTFDVVVTDGSGAPVVDSTSTFLMGSDAAAEPGPDAGEPSVTEGSAQRTVSELAPSGEGDLPVVVRSASRLDLVRYAGASGDFNPIHFDHDAARSAGLDGIVVHGLLMAAWLTQLATATTPGDAPLEEVRLRFRNALRPARQATASGTVDSATRGSRSLQLVLRDGDVDLVTARAVTRA
jgi:acyl dehydratase